MNQYYSCIILLYWFLSGPNFHFHCEPDTWGITWFMKHYHLLKKSSCLLFLFSAQLPKTNNLHSPFLFLLYRFWSLDLESIIVCMLYMPRKNLYASFNSMWDHKWNVSKVSSSLGSSNRNAVYSCCIAFWLLFMSWYFHDVFISHQLFTPGSISEPIDFNLTMIKLPWAAASVLHLYAGICL